ALMRRPARRDRTGPPRRGPDRRHRLRRPVTLPDMEMGLAFLADHQRYALTIHDASPVQDVARIWRSAVQMATVGIFVLMFIAFLYCCHALIVPIMAAVVVGATFAPLIGKAAEHGVPRWLGALIVVGLLLGAISVAVTTAAGPVAALVGRAPEIGAAIKEKLY